MKELEKQRNEINGILDTDYFHVCKLFCVEQNEGKIEWSVFYKNLAFSEYYSYKNEALLTSKNNTLDDLYKLKEKFEEEKEKLFEENFINYLEYYFSYNKFSLKIKMCVTAFLIELSTIIFILGFINLFVNNNDVWASMIIMTFPICIFVLGNLLINKLDKLLDIDFRDDYKKILTRNLDFLKRLRI